MFAVFRKRDFSLLWLAQLVSTAGSSLTDLAAGIYVWRETESALAVGLTLMVTAIPSLVVGLLAGVYVDRHDRQADHDLDLPDPGRPRRRSSRSSSASTRSRSPGLYLLLLLNAGVKQFFDPAHDSLIPEIASDEELAAANSFLSIASFGSTAIGFAGAGLLAGTVGLTVGVHHRRRDVPLRGRLHRADGPLPDAEARRRRQRRGHRGQPEVGHVDAVRDADHPLAVHRRRVHVLLVRPVERPAPAVLAPGPRARPSSSTGSRRA